MTKRHFSAHIVSSFSTALGLLGICILVVLSGSGQESVWAQQTASPSFIRVIHASPDVGTADVFVDGATLLSSFAFGSVTEYAPIPAGPHKVQIALVGKGIGASVITQTLAVSPGVVYTVAAIGTKATGLSLEVFIDTNLIAPGTAKLRVYQLSPDAGSVSVSTSDRNLLSSISYKNASDYLSIAASSYTFNVASSANNATLSTSATLNANTVASIFVVGMFTGTPRSALVTTQTAGLPGVPGTGSDPRPSVQPDHIASLAFWSWSLALAFLLLISVGIFLRRGIVK